MPWTKISMNKASQVRTVEARLVRLLLSRRACARGCGTTWDDLSTGCWVYHRPGARLTWLCEPCAAPSEEDDSAIPLLWWPLKKHPKRSSEENSRRVSEGNRAASDDKQVAAATH